MIRAACAMRLLALLIPTSMGGILTQGAFGEEFADGADVIGMIKNPHLEILKQQDSYLNMTADERLEYEAFIAKMRAEQSPFEREVQKHVDYASLLRLGLQHAYDAGDIKQAGRLRAELSAALETLETYNVTTLVRTNQDPDFWDKLERATEERLERQNAPLTICGPDPDAPCYSRDVASGTIVILPARDAMMPVYEYYSIIDPPVPFPARIALPHMPVSWHFFDGGHGHGSVSVAVKIRMPGPAMHLAQACSAGVSYDGIRYGQPHPERARLVAEYAYHVGPYGQPFWWLPACAGITHAGHDVPATVILMPPLGPTITITSTRP